VAEQRQAWDGTLTLFETGLAAFRRRQWQEAADAFSAILAQRSKDGPSSFYLKRCRQYLEQPPGPEWEAISSFSD
jgi:adenylate cyclase